MMGADVDRHGAEIVQLLEEHAAVFHGGVVAFVVAEPAVDRLVRADAPGKVHIDRDRSLCCCLECGSGTEQG